MNRSVANSSHNLYFAETKPKNHLDKDQLSKNNDGIFDHKEMPTTTKCYSPPFHCCSTSNDVLAVDSTVEPQTRGRSLYTFSSISTILAFFDPTDSPAFLSDE